MKSYSELLDEAGFFDFEVAESMLTPDYFPTLKKLKINDIVRILLLVQQEILILNKKNLKFFSFLNRQETDSKLNSLFNLENRIYKVLLASTQWIDDKKLLNHLPDKNN